MRHALPLTALGFSAMLGLSGAAGAAIIVSPGIGYVDGYVAVDAPTGIVQQTTTHYDFSGGNWTANVGSAAAGPSPGTGRAATTGAMATSTTATSTYASFAMSGTDVGLSAIGCSDGSCGATVGDPLFQIAQKWTFQVTAGSSYDYAGAAGVALSALNPDSSLLFSHTALLQKTGSPGFLFLQGSRLQSDGAQRSETLGETTGSLGEGTYTYQVTITGQAYSELAIARSVSADTFAQLQVGVTPVPLPAAAWLLLSGLAGVATFARHNRRVEPESA